MSVKANSSHYTPSTKNIIYECVYESSAAHLVLCKIVGMRIVDIFSHHEINQPGDTKTDCNKHKERDKE